MGKRWRLQFLKNVCCHRRPEIFLILLNTRNAVSIHVKLLKIFQAVHWYQLTVISWNKCGLLAFTIIWIILIRNIWVPLFVKVELSDHEYSSGCSRYEKFSREADYPLLSLSISFRYTFDLATLLLSSTNFFAVITFSCNELQLFRFFVSHFICKAVLYSLFIHSDNYFFYSSVFKFLFLFHFLSFLI